MGNGKYEEWEMGRGRSGKWEVGVVKVGSGMGGVGEVGRGKWGGIGIGKCWVKSPFLLSRHIALRTFSSDPSGRSPETLEQKSGYNPLKKRSRA